MQYEPKEKIQIPFSISDPLETSTLYVRAYMRDAKTDELLDTIDLTDKGDQRFRGEVEAPHDPTGNGRYITINIKTFDDSGYTSENPIYRRAERTYLIQTRPKVNMGGGGADVNYDKVRRIIKEEIDKIPEIEIPKTPKQEVVDLTPLLRELRNVKEAVISINIPKMPKIPKPEKVDLTPVLKTIQSVENSITKTIGRIPKPEKVDLTPLAKAFEGLKSEIKDSTLNFSLNGKKINLDSTITKEKEEPIKLVNFKKYLTKR